MRSESSTAMIKVAIPLFIIVFLLGLLFFSALTEEPKSLVPSMRTNKPLPAFDAQVLFENHRMNASELTGRYRLLNFWGSWCTTCYVEHPYLMQLAREGIEIVGVNYKDDEKDAKRFLDKLGNPYVFSFFDPKGKIAIEMGIIAAPETFLLSPEGKVIYHRIGEMHPKIFESEIRPLMESNNTHAN